MASASEGLENGEQFQINGKPLTKLKVDKLKQELGNRGLEKSGLKKELQERFCEALEKERNEVGNNNSNTICASRINTYTVIDRTTNVASLAFEIESPVKKCELITDNNLMFADLASNKPACSCQCGVLAAELEGIKLDMTIQNKNIDSRIFKVINAWEKDKIVHLKKDLYNEREKRKQLEDDLAILIKGRNQEVNDLNNTIASLENKVKVTETNNESLKALIMNIYSDKHLKPNQGKGSPNSKQSNNREQTSNDRLIVSELVSDNTNDSISEVTKYTCTKSNTRTDLLLSACKESERREGPSSNQSNDRQQVDNDRPIVSEPVNDKTKFTCTKSSSIVRTDLLLPVCKKAKPNLSKTNHSNSVGLANLATQHCSPTTQPPVWINKLPLIELPNPPKISNIHMSQTNRHQQSLNQLDRTHSRRRHRNALPRTSSKSNIRNALILVYHDANRKIG